MRALFYQTSIYLSIYPPCVCLSVSFAKHHMARPAHRRHRARLISSGIAAVVVACFAVINKSAWTLTMFKEGLETINLLSPSPALVVIFDRAADALLASRVKLKNRMVVHRPKIALDIASYLETPSGHGYMVVVGPRGGGKSTAAMEAVKGRAGGCIQLHPSAGPPCNALQLAPASLVQVPPAQLDLTGQHRPRVAHEVYDRKRTNPALSQSRCEKGQLADKPDLLDKHQLGRLAAGCQFIQGPEWRRQTAGIGFFVWVIQPAA
jgi:hypothetical protein